MLDIKAMKVLLAVAEAGNMTGAAKSLGITQSAVSQVIQQIEREVGTRLFDRAHRPLRPTASGNVVVSRAGHIIRETEQIIAAARMSATVPELRIGLIDSFAGVIGPRIARVCMDRVSNLTIWSGLTSILEQDFHNRKVAIMVCPEGDFAEVGLRQIPLFREPFILGVPKSTTDRSTPWSLESLSARFPMVRYSSRSPFGKQIDQHFRRIGLSPARRLEMDTSESVFPMVSEGIGWAVTTPLCVLHAKVDLERVALLPLPGPKVSRDVVLVHRSGEYDDLARQIAEVTWRTMLEFVVPEVRRSMPQAVGEIVVHQGGGAACTEAAMASSA